MIHLPPAQVIEQRLIECGLNPKGYTVAYEDYLQSIEVVIKPEAGATKEHFQCVHEAAKPEIVTFADTDLMRQYYDFVGELYRPQMIEDVKQSLRKLNRLDNFPIRAAYQSDRLFGEALEAHCGLKKDEALKEFGEGLMFQPPRDTCNDADVFHDRYSCVLTAIHFAVLNGDLKNFGFVGNEQYHVEEEQK